MFWFWHLKKNQKKISCNRACIMDSRANLWPNALEQSKPRRRCCAMQPYMQRGGARRHTASSTKKRAALIDWKAPNWQEIWQPEKTLVVGRMRGGKRSTDVLKVFRTGVKMVVWQSRVCLSVCHWEHSTGTEDFRERSAVQESWSRISSTSRWHLGSDLISECCGAGITAGGSG